jgi:hypothetical protein
MQLVLTLNPALVRQVIADIRGDGALALDANALITKGWPAAFIEPLVERIAASEFTRQFVETAGPSTQLRSVWSLALLRALITHYGLDETEPYMGRSRNAEVLSRRVLDSLKGGA